MEDDFEELRKSLIKKTKERISKDYESEEYALMQAINAYNETLKVYNTLYERLAEWYSLYFPELPLQQQKSLADLVMVLNTERDIGAGALQGIFEDRNKAESIAAKAASSIGRRMTAEEKDTILEYAKLYKQAEQTLKALEGYMKASAGRIMPNTTYLTDEKIAAELLAKAGSMERLATFPSSTIQLLGAEKALFKHIKFGSKPPKYGSIFKLPAISNARHDIRGKIARMYAAKIAMALKADYYSKKFIADKLMSDLEAGIKKANESPEKPKKQTSWKMGSTRNIGRQRRRR
ncbi:NOP58 family protein [Candidatus Marsarchaeota archaeon]|nr:NOP58 family protein [Candidatus Marsarchaeota archaeon]MCL5405098.1 NOP58 family protein [Candidatus Marsarchaeota archaeon]